MATPVAVTGCVRTAGGIVEGGVSVLAALNVVDVVTDDAEVIFPVSTTSAPDGSYTLSLYKNVDLLPANTYYNVSVGGIASLRIVVTGAGTVEVLQISSAPLPSLDIPESQVTGLVGDLAEIEADIIALEGGGGAVLSVAGRTGVVVLANTDISGLGTASTHAATDFDASGAAAAAQAAAQAASDPSGSAAAAQAAAIAASAQRASNLSDLASAATARTNLGLGTAATHATGDYDASGAAGAAQAFAIQRANHTGTQALSTISDAGTAASHAVGDFDAAGLAAAAQAAAIAASAQRASNLSDLASAATARTNLGLGTAATHATGDYDATGAAAAAQAAAIQRANHTGTQLLATISDAGTAASHAATDFALVGDSRFTQVSANTQTASYTLVLTDAGLVVEMNVAGANTLTVPTNASVAFPVGTILEVFQVGAGQCTITAAGGVTFRSDGAKTKTAAQYASVSLRKRGTDEWVLSGDLSA